MSSVNGKGRHREIETLCFCASPRTTFADWASCLTEGSSGSGEAASPIDEFYLKHEGLTALSGLIGASLRAELAPVLADQLLLGYVSATELYFRRLTAAAARLCPIVRARARDVEIAFGALDFYPSDAVEYSLTEKLTLTEQGKIKSLLDARFGVVVNQHPDLERAIDQFEKLCHLRHALVHSSGVVNSRNAKSLGHEGSRTACRVNLGPAELQLAASVCMDLVRSAHDEVGKHVLWGWVRSGYLKGNRSQDRGKVERFAQVFFSVRDQDSGLAVTTRDGLHALVRSLRQQTVASSVPEVLVR